MDAQPVKQGNILCWQCCCSAYNTDHAPGGACMVCSQRTFPLDVTAKSVKVFYDDFPIFCTSCRYTYTRHRPAPSTCTMCSFTPHNLDCLYIQSSYPCVFLTLHIHNGSYLTEMVAGLTVIISDDNGGGKWKHSCGC